jgi:hypothetical protein
MRGERREGWRGRNGHGERAHNTERPFDSPERVEPRIHRRVEGEDAGPGANPAADDAQCRQAAEVLQEGEYDPANRSDGSGGAGRRSSNADGGSPPEVRGDERERTRRRPPGEAAGEH